MRQCFGSGVKTIKCEYDKPSGRFRGFIQDGQNDFVVDNYGCFGDELSEEFFQRWSVERKCHQPMIYPGKLTFSPVECVPGV